MGNKRNENREGKKEALEQKKLGFIERKRRIRII